MTRSISQKLGHKPGMTMRVIAPPPSLSLDLPEALDAEAPDIILAFVSSTAEVGPRLADAMPLYTLGNRLWFAYPKKTGAIKTDITRDSGWEALAAHDLLPVMQIAIDDTWSALRFRYRDEIAKLTRKF